LAEDTLAGHNEDDMSAAFVNLLTQHQSILYGYVFNLVLNAADSDDLLQETNLVLWKKRHEFQLGTNFMAWSCRIAYFNVQNFIRTKGRSRLFFNQELLAKLADLHLDRAKINSVHSTLLADCLGKLSTASQELLKLCYDDNQSIQDVAKQLGRPVGSIYNTLSQIRFKIWKCIKHALNEEGSF
jgi:RNA polymerase sigma-70 factor, ECF subfamily